MGTLCWLTETFYYCEYSVLVDGNFVCYGDFVVSIYTALVDGDFVSL